MLIIQGWALEVGQGAGFASKCGAKVVINNEHACMKRNVLQHKRNVCCFFYRL